jgi:hypothetical protein
MKIGSVRRMAAALAVVALGYGTAATAAAGDAPAVAADAQSAVWAPKELRFTYQGFTTHYSCDGLREKVRAALLALGARKKDLSVQEWGCSTPSGRPDPFPAVSIKVQVLQPVVAATAADATRVAAHWKAVDLRLDRDPLSQSGDCELLEQIKQSILPLFSTRNVEYSSNCVPHQLSAGGTRLRAEVLVSDAPGTGSAAAAAAR